MNKFNSDLYGYIADVVIQGGNNFLYELDDVSISGVINGQVLTYENGLWTPKDVSGTGGSGDVTKSYVDGSLAVRDGSITALFARPVSDVSKGYIENNFLEGDKTATHSLYYGNMQDSSWGSMYIYSNKWLGADESGNVINMQLTNKRLQGLDAGYIGLGLFGRDYIDSSNYTSIYIEHILDIADSYTVIGRIINPFEDTYVDNNFIKINGTFSSPTSEYTVDVSDNNGIIDASGTYNIIFPDSLPSGFSTTVFNIGTGILTLNASTLISADSSVRLISLGDSASVVHKGAGVFYAMGKLS